MLIDSHCHIPHRKYERSIEQIVKDAQEAGVARLINIGTSLDENKIALETSEKFENVYTAIAIYPHEDLGRDLKDLINHLSAQIDSSKKVVAVGECGIDITDWPGGRDLNEQLDLFEMQIQLAIKKKLPLIIHNRNGDEYVLNLLKKYQSQGLYGVIHCFSSDWEVAKSFLDSNFHISFGGMITYKSRKDLLEVVGKVPEDRILIETDSPYLPPDGFRGQPNEPRNVAVVAAKIAEVRGVSFDKISELTYSNTCKLFNLPVL